MTSSLDRPIAPCRSPAMQEVFLSIVLLLFRPQAVRATTSSSHLQFEPPQVVRATTSSIWPSRCFPETAVDLSRVHLVVNRVFCVMHECGHLLYYVSNYLLDFQKSCSAHLKWLRYSVEEFFKIPLFRLLRLTLMPILCKAVLSTALKFVPRLALPWYLSSLVYLGVLIFGSILLFQYLGVIVSGSRILDLGCCRCLTGQHPSSGCLGISSTAFAGWTALSRYQFGVPVWAHRSSLQTRYNRDWGASYQWGWRAANYSRL